VVDTTATGKLYRRGFLEERGISFLEGVHYEDLIFSAEVYSSAKCIVVIPERVYIWKVYPVVVRKSITNMRDDEINLVHRLEATGRVDDVVSTPGRELLKKRYQQKFLEHDARLYLKDMGGVPQRQAERVLETLEPRLRAIPRDVFARLTALDRLLYGAALSHSVDGVRELAPSLVGRWTLEGRTLRSGDSVQWRPSAPLPSEPESGSLEYWLLDISGDAILQTPLNSMVYRHRLTSVTAQGPKTAQVAGFTLDPLELLVPGVEQAKSRLVFSLRDSEYEFTCPLVLRARGAQSLEWQARVRVPRGMPLVRPMQFDVALEVQRGRDTTRSAVWLDGEIDIVRVRPSAFSLRALLQQWFTFRGTRAGRLALRLSDPHGRRGRLDEFVHGLAGYSGRPTPE
jgi:CDP-glycerol glycerophosphotransferase